MIKTFDPVEHIVELKGEPYFLGQIHLFKENSGAHNVEVNLITTEGHKIFRHLGRDYKLEDEREAISRGFQILREFIAMQEADH